MNDVRLRSRLRLVPLTAVMISKAPAAHAAEFAPPAADHRRVADGAVRLCAQVLDGSRSPGSLRRFMTGPAFAQFNGIQRRLRPAVVRHGAVVMRLSRSTARADGVVDIVATIQIGVLVRAVAMQAQLAPQSQWRLTMCHLVGGY